MNDADQPTSLPPSWITVELGEVVSRLTNGYVGPTRDIYVSEGVPYLLSKHVKKNRLRFDGQTHVTDEFNQKNRKSILKEGDVLLVQTGHVGESAVVPREHEGHNCHAMIVITPVPGVLDGRFLSLYFGSPQTQDAFTRMHKGMTLKHLNCHDVIRLRTAVPPIAEQRRIVAKLERMLERSRQAREALDAIPPLLERLRQSILAAAFRGDLTADWRAENPGVEPASKLLERIRIERRRRWEDAELDVLRAKGKTPKDDGWKERYETAPVIERADLPPLPDGWCWASVEEAGQVDLGRMRSPDNHRGTNVRPYLRVKNVFEDRIQTTDVMEMHFSPEEFEFYRLLPGDVLLNEGQSKELVGRPAMFRGELPSVAFTNSLIRFRPYGGAPPEYALALFRHYMRSGRFQKIAQITTNIAHLGANRLRELEYPLAPLDEQIAIARTVANAMARVDAAEAVVDTLRKRCSDFDAACLGKAFRGELVPQDPADEPASVLLARIKAQREQDAESKQKPTKNPRRATAG